MLKHKFKNLGQTVLCTMHFVVWPNANQLEFTIKCQSHAHTKILEILKSLIHRFMFLVIDNAIVKINIFNI